MPCGNRFFGLPLAKQNRNAPESLRHTFHKMARVHFGRETWPSRPTHPQNKRLPMNRELPEPLNGVDGFLFRQANLIDGRWSEFEQDSKLEVVDPATSKLIGTVPTINREGVRKAIDAAQQCFRSWRKTSAKERSDLLRRIHGLMMQHQESLARLLTAEQGKPLTESRAEIAYSASYFEWFAEEAKRTYGDIIPAQRSTNRMLVLKEPVGVSATITPWNFPSAMLARKVAPALAAGCTVVSKPAELTPFSALAMGALAMEAGLPAGAWNIITGAPEMIGAELCENEAVRKLSFTGSTEVGKRLMKQCSGTLKRLSLELGGNAPFIVFESADIQAAVRGAIASKYRNSGQTCVCVNRFLVQDSIYDEFAEKLITASKQLRIGNGLVDGIELGPLINDAAVKKVERHVSDAIAQGGQVACGGKRDSRGGTFFEPTVILEANSEMVLAHEEIFGPVSALFRFHTESDAVDLANASRVGLAAYLYSRDLSQIWRVAEQLEVGMVGVNEGVISSEMIPFGGIKESGFGREGGRYGIDEYLQLKYVCLNIN
jgi:succinate-semialdehyde dehydrogenase / glutarate-semialdehyde dehydrogenase